MEFSFNLILLLIIFGFLFGFLASLTGTGGGPFYVPFLTIFINVAIQEAIDTSIMIILLTSSISLYAFLKQKRCNIKIALVFSIFTIIGSLISQLIFSIYPLNGEFLMVIFAALLLVIAVNMIYKIRKNDQQQDTNEGENCEEKNFHTFREDLKKGIPFFIFSGFAANLLGIGGGVINTPALHLVIGYSIHFATGISTAMVFFTALFNTIIKVIIGQIDYTLALIMGPGAMVGSAIGAHVSNKMSSKLLQLVVACILVFLAILMLVA